MKNIYEISEFYNSKGFGYCFNATDKCKYTLLFNNLGGDKFIFEFDKTESLDKNSINNKLISDSICKVIYNFITANPERVIFIVYDNADYLDKVRYRLFNIWFKHYNKSNYFKKMNILTSKQEIVSIIFMSNNVKFIKEIRYKDS